MGTTYGAVDDPGGQAVAAILGPGGNKKITVPGGLIMEGQSVA